MKRNVFLSLLLVLALLLVAGYALPLLPGSMALAANQPATAALPSTGLAAPRLSSLSDLESQYVNIYNQVGPSVVAIDVVEQGSAGLPPNHPTTPGLGNVPQQAAGSGFVWDTNGNIVTNNHVVNGATSIEVTFADGTILPAKVVGTDPDSDLAVIKVNAPAGLLKPVQVGDSTKLKVGQLAIAIGNPFSEQNTMTTGIISALGRSLPGGSSSTIAGPSYSIPDVIQTDAPINPGNSGGVLLDSQGLVIGVTAAIESQSGSSSGIGFAIPAAILQRVIPVLITSGHYDHPYLGVSGATLTPVLAQAMNLKPEQRGALVASVVPNGPAAKAGLQGGNNKTAINGIQATVGGDVITAIDGQAVKSFDDVVAYLARATKVGQNVTLTILRGGKEQTINIILGSRPGGGA